MYCRRRRGFADQYCGAACCRLLVTRGLPAALGAASCWRPPPRPPGWFFPESGGSPNADEIRTLYMLIFVARLVVFVGVEGALVWAMIKFRARKGAVAAQIHGNTRLEIGWTVGAAVILVFLTVFTFIMLPGIKNPAASDDRRERQPGRGVQRASTPPPTSPTPPDGSASSTSASTASSTCGATSTRGEARTSSPTRTWSCRSA